MRSPIFGPTLMGSRVWDLPCGLLVCGDCGSHFVIRKRSYYGCAADADRGPHVCANSRLVAREHLEKVVLNAIFEEVFTAETLAYLSQKVNEAIANASMAANDLRKKRQAELAEARKELDNIRSAIRQGIFTSTTREMLTETEERIARLEASLHAPARQRNVVYLPSLVKACLRDLKAP